MPTKKQPERPTAPPLMCATAGCPNDAKVKVQRHRTVTVPDKPHPVHVAHGAWLNVCHACEDRIRRKENEEYCAATGIDTPAKQRRWCLTQLRRGALLPRVSREPGQDDEEVTA
jgi:hypothetical protein